jgi:hypothetical protein
MLSEYIHYAWKADVSVLDEATHTRIPPISD